MQLDSETTKHKRELDCFVLEEKIEENYWRLVIRDLDKLRKSLIDRTERNAMANAGQVQP